MNPKYNKNWYHKLLKDLFELVKAILFIVSFIAFLFIAGAVLTMLVSMLFDILTGYDLLRNIIRPFFRQLLGLP